MKQLIIILIVLAVALFIVVGCKGDGGGVKIWQRDGTPTKWDSVNTITPTLTIDSSDGIVGWVDGRTKDVDTLSWLPIDTFLMEYRSWAPSGALPYPAIIIGGDGQPNNNNNNDTFPFLNVLKDTTFSLSRMKTFEFFIGDAGDMVARKHLNGEWEVLDCGRALNVILKMNKEATNEIEKLEAQLDGFRSAYKHDDIRVMHWIRGNALFLDKDTINKSWINYDDWHKWAKYTLVDTAIVAHQKIWVADPAATVTPTLTIKK